MEWYAIRSKRSHKFISGTDFRTRPAKQIIADDFHAPRVFTKQELNIELKRREVSMHIYEVVKVNVVAEDDISS